MNYVYPTQIVSIAGTTYLVVPQLARIIEHWTDEVADGVPITTLSCWTYHVGFPEGTWSVMLNVSFPDELEIHVVLTPYHWDCLGDIMRKAPDIALVGNPEYLHDGKIERYREHELGMAPTYLLIERANKGLQQMIPGLEQLKAKGGDEKKQITYLLGILKDQKEKVEG